MRRLKNLCKILLVVLLLMLVAMSSCDTVDEKKSDFTSLESIITDNLVLTDIDLQPNQLITSIKSKVIRNQFDTISEVLLSNSTFLSGDLENIEYEDEKIPWHSLTSTYNLYLNSFNDIEILLHLYEISKDNRYLEEGKRLILSWFEYESSEISSANEYLWYDHSVSCRTLVLIHFALYSEVDSSVFTEDFIDKINENIRIHGRWLYDDKNYVSGNHGIMMDRALLLASLYIEDETIAKQYLHKALLRLEQAVIRDFSSDGVHLENSPGYHYLLVEWFVEIKALIGAYLDLPSNTILDIPTVYGLDYIRRVIMPNNYIPRIGDTSYTAIPLDTDDALDDDKLQYILSNGSIGLQPTAGIRFYKNAGIAVYRDTYDSNSADKATWWHLKSGAKSTIHKQDDDLSFMLYSHNNEIFSDGGQYNYVDGDTFRQYIISPLAHNSFSLKDMYYAKSNYDKVSMLELVEETDEYLWFRGINKAYEHTILQRNFIFIYPNIFLIIDDGFSMYETQEYSQHFLLGPNMDVKRFDETGFYALSKDEMAWVQLIQHNSIDEENLVVGDKRSGIGYISEYFEQVTETNHISFINNKKATRYITTIVQNGDPSDVVNVQENNDQITISINSDKYTFSVEPIDESKIGKGLNDSLLIEDQIVEHDNGVYRYSLLTYNNNLEYAFYLYKDDIRISYQSYSSKSYFEFSPTEPGEYKVKFFIVKNNVKDKQKNVKPGNKLSGMFDKSVVINHDNLEYTLAIEDQYLSRNDSEYTFTLKLYNTNILYAFYLYKDGKKIGSQYYTKCNSFSFNPEGKGEYAVKWFIVRDVLENPGAEPTGINKQSGYFIEKVIIE